LLVDAGHFRWVSCIIDADHLNGTAEKPPFSIDVLLPDLMCKPSRLAV
jgi:hypothetical protein